MCTQVQVCENVFVSVTNVYSRKLSMQTAERKFVLRILSIQSEKQEFFLINLLRFLQQIFNKISKELTSSL